MPLFHGASEDVRLERWAPGSIIVLDEAGGAEILVVAGLAVVVRTTAQRARGSPLDQYLPWYIVRLCGVLSEKFTESLNSVAGIARVESEEGTTRNTKRHEKAWG